MVVYDIQVGLVRGEKDTDGVVLALDGNISLPFIPKSNSLILHMLWPDFKEVNVINISPPHTFHELEGHEFEEVLEVLVWLITTIQNEGDELGPPWSDKTEDAIQKCQKAGREMIEWEEDEQRINAIF